MKKLILGVVAIALFALSSCKREDEENVNPDAIWKKYTATYNSQTSSLEVRAIFRIRNETGTKLRLKDNSNISYGGIDLNWKTAWAYYSIEQSTFVNDGAFLWLQSNGEISEQALPIKTAAKPIGLDTLNNNESFEMPFYGEALESGETIKVFFTDATNATRSFTQVTTGATAIPIEITSFNDLELGSISVYFVRTKEGTFTDDSAGGAYEVSYTSPLQNIHLKD